MMSRFQLGFSVFVFALLAADALWGRELRESRVIEESFSIPPAAGVTVIVDNIFGSVDVRAHESEVVVLVAREERSADSPEAMARSWEETGLQIEHNGGEVEFYVDGPFRDGDCRCSGPSYEVRYDFELLVPQRANFIISTVNDGDIRIAGVEGDFEVSNVNGSIHLSGLGGSGEVETVNGEITAVFEKNPRSDTRFVTINGDVEARFQPDLSADLDLESRWGEVWTDYPVVPLANPAPLRRKEGGRTVIEISDRSRVRVGDGGPELVFETLNGDIYVRRSASSG